MKSKWMPLERAEVGMVLAQDVLDAGGGCLLAQGGELTEASLASLRRRGVDHVVVAVAEEALSAEQRAAREAEMRARIDRLFRKAGSDPMLLKLHATILQYRLAGLNEN
ncbi:MAG: hypothetical protein PHX38_11950 [Sulfuricella sp.]|nr:hypothetical protein [Sulfuricella sp.]